MKTSKYFTPKVFDIPGPTVLVGLVNTDTGIQLVKATVVNDKIKTVEISDALSKVEVMGEVQRKLLSLFLEVAHSE